VLIGNSDGIGLATTKRLLASGWNVLGVSKSESLVRHREYQHRVADVTDPKYPELLDELVLSHPLDLCIFFVGIGERLDLLDMSSEAKVIDVNLTSMVKTASRVIPAMVRQGSGHFIGLSSLADELHSDEAAAYCASKAGFSSYLLSLASATRARGVYVTNIRFGFVDTKMAKSDSRPFMMSVDKAVDHVEYCIRHKPERYSAPRIVIPLLKLLKLLVKLRVIDPLRRKKSATKP
jgi:short-subunit dehydrogenase